MVKRKKRNFAHNIMGGTIGEYWGHRYFFLEAPFRRRECHRYFRDYSTAFFLEHSLYYVRGRSLCYHNLAEREPLAHLLLFWLRAESPTMFGLRS